LRRHYQLDLRAALHTMPWVDLRDLIRGMPPEWGWVEENSARTHELAAFMLEHEYAQWTVDPEDPEYRAEQARRKRDGVKPPPRPLIPPVALRPKWLATILADQYALARAAADKPMNTATSEQVSSAEFDRLLDL
jgi:hypothetical protein